MSPSLFFTQHNQIFDKIRLEKKNGIRITVAGLQARQFGGAVL